MALRKIEVPAALRGPLSGRAGLRRERRPPTAHAGLARPAAAAPV